MEPLPTSIRQTAIFLQDSCYQHRYIRSTDLSAIVERPERLRALKIGIAAAIARLEHTLPSANTTTAPDQKDSDDLASALERLNLSADVKTDIVDIVKSTAAIDLLNNSAVKFVHGDIEGDVYLEKLVSLAKDSEAKVSKGVSEIPENLSQGDLYLCPGSLDAIQGALGTVCEAVDTVIHASRSTTVESDSATAPTTSQTGSSDATRAFVAIRPPGHHCGEDTPSGFCFVNNVAVAAAHGHLKHGVTKVVILDIDLHHGNGTQSIAWQINEESYRATLDAPDSEASHPSKPGFQIFYGSLHDILSYPCEDGGVALVQAASTSVHGPHGQYIENVHLQTYTSDEDFWGTLYPGPYGKLLRKAEAFLKDSDGDNALVFISCGFDASEHEYESMSRHGRKVPASFYYRFAQDARIFADKYANGKLVSVLEGGYSDRALTSGALAHICGLVDIETRGGSVDKEWWGTENLIQLEKATKKRRGGKISLPASGSTEKWLERTLTVFSSIDTIMTPSPSRVALQLAPSFMTLRERRSPFSTSVSPRVSPQARRGKGKVTDNPQAITDVTVVARSASEHGGTNGGTNAISEEVQKVEVTDLEKDESKPAASLPKKLPRVILRVKDPEE